MKIAQKCGFGPNQYTNTSLFVFAILASVGNICCYQNTTLFLAVLFKEGLTTPVSRDYGVLKAEIYKQYAPRELTLVGQRQMYELGRRMRNKYKEFLTNLTNPEDYTIIAMNKSCHKASMVSFNSGFLSEDKPIEYPPNTAAKVGVEYPIREETLSHINFTQPLPSNQVIFIYNRYFGFKVQKDVVFWDRSSPDECPSFATLFPKSNGKELDRFITENTNRLYAAVADVLDHELAFIMEDLLGPINIHDTQLISAMADYLRFNQLHNKSAKFRSGNTSFEAVQEVADRVFWEEVRVPDRSRLGMSPLLKYMAEKVEALARGNPDKHRAKVLLASVSDDVLSTFFSAFELTDLARRRQEYGANLVLEVYRGQQSDGSSKVFIKVLHNGVPLRICGDSQQSTDCPTEVFLEQAVKVLDPHWKLKCGLQVPENIDKLVLNAMNTLLTIFFVSTVLVVFYVLYSFRKRSQDKSRNSASGEKISLGFKITFENNANRESDFNLDIMDNREKAKVKLN